MKAQKRAGLVFRSIASFIIISLAFTPSLFSYDNPSAKSALAPASKLGAVAFEAAGSLLSKDLKAINMGDITSLRQAYEGLAPKEKADAIVSISSVLDRLDGIAMSEGIDEGIKRSAMALLEEILTENRYAVAELKYAQAIEEGRAFGAINLGGTTADAVLKALTKKDAPQAKLIRVNLKEIQGLRGDVVTAISLLRDVINSGIKDPALRDRLNATRIVVVFEEYENPAMAYYASLAAQAAGNESDSFSKNVLVFSRINEAGEKEIVFGLSLLKHLALTGDKNACKDFLTYEDRSLAWKEAEKSVLQTGVSPEKLKPLRQFEEPWRPTALTGVVRELFKRNSAGLITVAGIPEGAPLKKEEAERRIKVLITNDGKKGLEAIYEEVDEKAKSGRMNTSEVIKKIGDIITGIKNSIRYVRPSDGLSSIRTSYRIGHFEGHLRPEQADILRGISEFLLQFDSQRSVNTISRLEAIKKAFKDEEAISSLLVAYFELKFNPAPGIGDAERGEQLEGQRKALEGMISGLQDDFKQSVFRKALEMVIATTKTNYFDKDKVSLGFAIEPKNIGGFSDTTRFKRGAPYSMYWIHVPYGGFGAHIRFAKLARGGVREDKFSNERQKPLCDVLEECYDLASTQHNKNADIPEGGSKGMYVYDGGISPVATGIGYMDAIIALMMPPKENPYYGKEKDGVDPLEIGPDVGTDYLTTLGTVLAYQKELDGTIARMLLTGKIFALGGFSHMHNNLFRYIKDLLIKAGLLSAGSTDEEADRRGNRVTSQGIMTHLYEMWPLIDKNPTKEAVRIKFTGGPDGDVGSGDLEIAIRQYGENAKIVSVSDGTGAAYDEQGLDHEELLRLYKEGKGIAYFDPAKLKGKEAFAVSCERETEITQGDSVELIFDTIKNLNTRAFVLFEEQQKGLGRNDISITRDGSGNIAKVVIKRSALRNIMFFLSKADAFVPGGGGRHHITEKNVDWFFDEEGNPTARIIAYGANVNTTDRANEILEDKGIIIEPDEKANSVGVEISSRVEVDANILFKLDELTTALRARYLRGVLNKLMSNAKLKHYALRIAKAKRSGEHIVTQISPGISKEIISFAEMIEAGFDRIDEDLMEACLKEYYPQIDGMDVMARVKSRMPKDRIKVSLSKFMASVVVYNAGVGYVEETAKKLGIKDDDRIEIVKAYVRAALDDSKQQRKLQLRKQDIFDRKFTMSPKALMGELLAIESTQQELVAHRLKPDAAGSDRFDRVSEVRIGS